MSDQYTSDAATAGTAVPDDVADEPTDPGESGVDGFFTEAVGGFQWIAAVVVGVATFVGAYTLMALLFLVGPASADGTTGDQLVQFGFVLYNAHNVPLTLASEGFTLTGGFTSNLLTAAGGTAVPTVVYYAVPVVALLAGGALFEWRRGNRDVEGVIEGAALSGMGIAAGYLTVAVVGTQLFVRRTTRGSAWLAVGPGLLETVVFATVYALAFATVGALAVRWRRYA